MDTTALLLKGYTLYRHLSKKGSFFAVARGLGFCGSSEQTRASEALSNPHWTNYAYVGNFCLQIQISKTLKVI